MTLGLINANPIVHAKKERITRTEDLLHASASADDAVDPLDIYDILAHHFQLLRYLIYLRSCVFVLTPDNRFCEGYKGSRTPVFTGTAQCALRGIHYC